MDFFLEIHNGECGLGGHFCDHNHNPLFIHLSIVNPMVFYLSIHYPVIHG